MYFSLYTLLLANVHHSPDAGHIFFFHQPVRGCIEQTLIFYIILILHCNNNIIFWGKTKKKNLVTTDRKCVRRGLAYKQLEPFMCVFPRPPVFITEKKITPPKFQILKRKGPLHTHKKKQQQQASLLLIIKTLAATYAISQNGENSFLFFTFFNFEKIMTTKLMCRCNDLAPLLPSQYTRPKE